MGGLNFYGTLRERGELVISFTKIVFNILFPFCLNLVAIRDVINAFTSESVEMKIVG